MYGNILVTLDCTPTDRAIIRHVKRLGRRMRSRFVLMHVADGWAARAFGANAVSAEIRRDTAYLSRVRAEFRSAGLRAETILAYGDPADEIVKWVKGHRCDLVAMSTHGHEFIADLVLGSTANQVRHRISVPLLLLLGR
ncbi:MAG: universal stress protein [Candidatus Coatesbacteria bacterium]